MRAAPSPTPPMHTHSVRHQSTSDEDNNAFDDKEEVNNIEKIICDNILCQTKLFNNCIISFFFTCSFFCLCFL